MKDFQRQLTKELQQAGASEAEMTTLLPIAADLRQLQGRKLAMPMAQRSSWRTQLFKPLLFIAPSLALGMAVVMFSQAVLPTSWLYPVQRLSSSVAIAAHPSYRATVMMRQAQQVNQLVRSHASQSVVLATLDGYTATANAYKISPHANYAAFEYCKTNLQQAAQVASGTVRQAITDSLNSLENT